ncbi:META domain-containing protein [Janthinobacterium sp. PLB04]|uniref:META domain-containing protein n=1 Tax=Janthinobacterium lividum TaxID=29581 RepID=A0AAJ4MWJ5_9BURK|nr:MULTISPECIES: META domain-containing protein [Janthinobacterium]KAB0324461.1 META domain-containing protein [Janthinobacterium lividum]QSX98564.1 META domain-containing protein [Janthinobacterium lividum]UGQ38526.1 META domain-containing protein [Janthinobacterium sp. PLB04]
MLHRLTHRLTYLPLAAAIAMAGGCATTPDSAKPDTGLTPMYSLTNTYWKLTQLDGADVTMAPEQEREVRITLTDDGKVHGFTGCNRMMGGYTLTGNVLRFTQLAGTRMACPPLLMQLESAVLANLNSVTGYRFEGEYLILLKDGAPVARFESVYL